MRYSPLALRTLLFSISLVIAATVNAQKVNSQLFTQGAFTEIQHHHSATPYIISFWSETCAYCMQELALLGDLLPQYPNITLVTISTDPFLETETIQHILEESKLTQFESWVFADNRVERLYADVDKDWHGELPLTYFFDKQGTPLKHRGTFNKAELIDWLNEHNNSLKP